MSNKMEETIKNIIDASNFIEPKKVPVGGDILGYALAYAGTTYPEVIKKPQKRAEAYCKIFDRLPLDFVGTSVTATPYNVFQDLGYNAYDVSHDGTGIIHRQAEMDCYCGPEAYDGIIADPFTYINETAAKRRFTIFQGPKEEAYETLKKSLAEFKLDNDANILIADYFKNKGIYCLYDSPYNFYSPFNKIFDTIRGIKDSLTDLRRYPAKVEAACDVMWEQDKLALQISDEEASSPIPFVVSTYHSECFLSPKHYDRFVWKYFLESCGPLMEKGKKVFVYGEGSLMHIYDRFRELPKGSIILMPDSDDVLEVHKKIGDWVTIISGVPAEIMAHGTKEQCVDYVKRLFDTLAPGGGFLFFTSRVLISGKDAKEENLFATYEAADELSRGRS